METLFKKNHKRLPAEISVGWVWSFFLWLLSLRRCTGGEKRVPETLIPHILCLATQTFKQNKLDSYKPLDTSRQILKLLVFNHSLSK